MLARLQHHLSFANVVSLIALFVALGGSSYAVVKVNGRDIENRTIAGKKLKNRTITKGKIKKNALTGAEINESRLRKVPAAARADSAAAALRAGSATTATSAGDANLLDGLNSTDFLKLGSGQTIRGAFEMNEDGGTGSGDLAETAIGFPVGAHLTSEDQVNFAPAAGFPGLASDADSSCTGTESNPTAPPGKVCLYVGQPNDVKDAQGFPGGSVSDPASFVYFLVDAHRDSGSGAFSLYGTWAYTVP